MYYLYSNTNKTVKLRYYARRSVINNNSLIIHRDYPTVLRTEIVAKSKYQLLIESISNLGTVFAIIVEYVELLFDSKVLYI